MAKEDELKNQLFSLLKKKDTQELHLFITERTSDGKCVVASADDKSICKKLDFKNRANDDQSFHCATANSARKKCAEIGTRVCGTCVSHLYANY
jgi:hypothetical protein